MEPIAARASRLTAAAFVLATGGVHLWLYFDYFHEVHVVGILFLLNAAGALAVAVPLVAVRARWPVAAGLAFSLGTLGAFLLSVYHGLFGYVESLTGAWQEAAASLELAAAAALVVAALAERRRSDPAARPYVLSNQVQPRRQQ